MAKLTPLRLAEGLHGIFYTPQFVALNHGFFRDEGLDVHLTTGGSGPRLAEMVLNDEADIGLTGPMRALVVANRGQRLINIAEFNSRNGFFLLGRRPEPDFKWTNLVGKTLISISEPPIPWLCTQYVLRRNGVDPKQVNAILDLPLGEMADAFRSGLGDYIEQSQPNTEILSAEGTAHLILSMGETVGPLPFSCYVCRPDFLEKHPDIVERFLRGFYRSLKWVHSHRPGEIAEAAAPSFPGVDRQILEKAIARYLRQNTWPTDPILRKPGFEYLQDIALSGGAIPHKYSYDEFVNTEIASKVVADLKGQ